MSWALSIIPLTNGQFGVGMIIRDWNRVIAVVSISLCPFQEDTLFEETKAIAVEQGLVLVKELGLEKIIIEFDSLLIVQAVELMDFRRVVGHIIKGIG